jgi:hypothetical protein
MAKKELTINDFSAGIGTLGEKRDVPGSAKFTKGLDPYEDLSYATLARKATKKSSTTVTNLPLWMVDGSPYTTNRFVYDLGGGLYTVDTDDAFTLSRTVSGGAGEGLEIYDDYLYYALGVNLGRYGKLSGTPAFDDDFMNWGTSTDLQETGGGTGAADYVPPTSISEAATARQTFTPTMDPIKSIVIDVDVVGTGDWTVTLHDAKNTLIGSATIANASMSTGDITFTFSTPLRVVRHNSYHFHVTSTVADGGVDTDAATDLEGAEYTINFAVLIDTDFHPMTVIDNDILVIGNDRYLATWDQATYEPNKIVFAAGYQCRALANFEEFIVAGCIKGTSINDAEGARIYVWDGISSSWTFSMPVPIGAVNALANYRGQLFGVYGSRGSVYQGYDPFKTVVHEIQKLTKGKYTEVYPGAITNYEGRLLIGYSGVTDDGTNLEQGVYEIGAQTENLEQALNYPFQVSTGTTKSTTLKIGMVKGIGKDLYIGWRDDSSYGVDKVALGDTAVAAGSYESLIFDAGKPKKEKLAYKVVITFEALTADQSVTPKYKIDRAASYTTGTAEDTVGETRAEVLINSRFKEIEVGFDLVSSSNTFIKITSITLEWDDLEEEKND